MRTGRRSFVAGVFGAVAGLLAALPACRSARGDSGPKSGAVLRCPQRFMRWSDDGAYVDDDQEPLVTEVTFITGVQADGHGNLVLATKKITCPPGTRAKLIFE